MALVTNMRYGYESYVAYTNELQTQLVKRNTLQELKIANASPRPHSPFKGNESYVAYTAISCLLQEVDQECAGAGAVPTQICIWFGTLALYTLLSFCK